jgi:hypothetical protein
MGYRERIGKMYQRAFGRPPNEGEIAEVLAFLKSREHDPAAWRDLCHVLINVKEFMYVN